MRHPDGIYIGQAMEEYVADDALSGSRFMTLLTDPGDVTWSDPSINPLFEPPETKPQLRGSAVHCAVLEGLEAFDDAYCLAPSGVLDSGDSMGAWLREAKASGVEHLAQLKVSGNKGELRARIEEARLLLPEDSPLYPRFADELIAGRRVLGSSDHAFVRMIERFVRSDEDFGKLVSNGVAEISIYLTLEGERFKCRPDYLNGEAITDLKSYGRPPGRARSLRQHLVREAFYNGYDLQAVHNAAMIAAAGALFLDGELTVSGDMNTANKLGDIFAAHRAKKPVFHWLFLRMGGAIAGIDIPFRESDGRWQYACQDVADAVEVYKRYRDECGDRAIWLTAAGKHEIQDTDWPLDAWSGRE